MTEHECRVFLELCHYLIKQNSREAFQVSWKNLEYLGARTNSAWSLGHHLSLVEHFTLSGHYDHMLRTYSQNQIESKLWLVTSLLNVLPSRPYRIAILGGWTGLLANIIMWRMPHLVSKIGQIEIDPEAQWIAKPFLADARAQGKFFQITEDANNIEFGHDYQLIINCSTEHFAEDRWYRNIPPGRLMAIQSTNNTEEPTHVNCVSQMSEFREKYPIAVLLYGGILDVGDNGRQRYTRIGRR